MVGKRVTPPSDVDFGDIKQCEKAVEDLVLGQYHANGSCAMGAALDSRLRVNGVNGLRVCDASVFPVDISGNLQATVYAVAEIAADFIKEEYQLSHLVVT
jgi:choline dehydrogenase-like flavoprotein